MKSGDTNPELGVTRIEVVLVTGVLLLLLGIILPGFGALRAKSRRIACVENLKQLGLAYRAVAMGSNGRFWTNRVESADRPDPSRDVEELWRQYLPGTNQPMVLQKLWCPADTERQAATAWVSNAANPRAVVFSSHRNLSYFLGLNASEDNPQSILAGDRNLTANGVALGPGRHIFPVGTMVGYTEEIHGSAGNVLLGDGSVQQGSNGRVKEIFSDSSVGPAKVWLVP